MKTSAIFVSGFAALAAAQNSTIAAAAAAPTSAAAAGGLPAGAGCGFNCMLRPLMYPRCKLLGTVLDGLVAALAAKAGVNTKAQPNGEGGGHSHGGEAAPASPAMGSGMDMGAGHIDMGAAHSDMPANMETMPMATDAPMTHSHSKRQGLDVLVSAAQALASDPDGILNQILDNLNTTGSTAGLAFDPKVKECLCTGTAGRKLKVAAEICVPKACSAYTAPLPIGGIYQGVVNYLCAGQPGWVNVPGAFDVGFIIDMAGGLKGLPSILSSLGSM